MFRMTTLVFAFATSLAGTAVAGEQYLDTTGFAVAGYDVVSYFDIAQSKVGVPQQSPLPGSAAIIAKYNGAAFAFATEANRDKFRAHPTTYVPQYDGHCAYGVAKGGKVPGNPTLWRIVDGKLYLNKTKNVVGLWEMDIPGNLMKAEGNWGGIDSAKASSDKIPDFMSDAPLAN